MRSPTNGSCPARPEGDILQTGKQIAAHHPSQAADRLGRDRSLRFVRHRRRALLPRCETFQACRPSVLARRSSTAANRIVGGRRQRPGKSAWRVPTLTCVRRHRRSPKPSPTNLDRRVDVGVRPHGARELARRRYRALPAGCPVRFKLQGQQRNLGAEGSVGRTPGCDRSDGVEGSAGGSMSVTSSGRSREDDVDPRAGPEQRRATCRRRQS